MFYVKNDAGEMVPPSSIYVKIDGAWTKTKGVFVNELKRKQVSIENLELLVSRSKRGVEGRIKALELVGDDVGRTTEQEIEYDKLKKTKLIQEIEMTELSKQSEMIKNQIYFNSKIYPGEEFIRLLKISTNNGASNFKVLKVVPFGKLNERPKVIFNNPDTDGTINNMYYRIIDTNIDSIEDVTLMLRRRLGQNFSLTYDTPQNRVFELNTIMIIHEEMFNFQLRSIQYRQDRIAMAIPVIKNYITQYPDLDRMVIDNTYDDNKTQLGYWLTDAQAVQSITTLSATNANFVAFSNEITTKYEISNEIVRINNEEMKLIDQSSLLESRVISMTKFGLNPDQVPVLTIFNDANLVTLKYKQNDDTVSINCIEDDSLVPIDTDLNLIP